MRRRRPSGKRWSRSMTHRSLRCRRLRVNGPDSEPADSSSPLTVRRRDKIACGARGPQILDRALTHVAGIGARPPRPRQLGDRCDVLVFSRRGDAELVGQRPRPGTRRDASRYGGCRLFSRPADLHDHLRSLSAGSTVNVCCDLRSDQLSERRTASRHRYARRRRRAA